MKKNAVKTLRIIANIQLALGMLTLAAAIVVAAISYTEKVGDVRFVWFLLMTISMVLCIVANGLKLAVYKIDLKNKKN